MLEGKSDSSFDLETDEFKSTRWFSISEMSEIKTDAYMDRFLKKLQSHILRSSSKLQDRVYE